MKTRDIVNYPLKGWCTCCCMAAKFGELHWALSGSCLKHIASSGLPELRIYVSFYSHDQRIRIDNAHPKEKVHTGQQVAPAAPSTYVIGGKLHLKQTLKWLQVYNMLFFILSFFFSFFFFFLGGGLSKLNKTAGALENLSHPQNCNTAYTQDSLNVRTISMGLTFHDIQGDSLQCCWIHYFLLVFSSTIHSSHFFCDISIRNMSEVQPGLSRSLEGYMQWRI